MARPVFAQVLVIAEGGRGGIGRRKGLKIRANPSRHVPLDDEKPGFEGIPLAGLLPRHSPFGLVLARPVPIAVPFLSCDYPQVDSTSAATLEGTWQTR